MLQGTPMLRLQQQRQPPWRRPSRRTCSSPLSCTAAALALSEARPASSSAFTLRWPGRHAGRCGASLHRRLTPPCFIPPGLHSQTLLHNRARPGSYTSPSLPQALHLLPNQAGALNPPEQVLSLQAFVQVTHPPLVRLLQLRAAAHLLRQPLPQALQAALRMAACAVDRCWQCGNRSPLAGRTQAASTWPPWQGRQAACRLPTDPPCQGGPPSTDHQEAWLPTLQRIGWPSRRSPTHLLSAEAPSKRRQLAAQRAALALPRVPHARKLRRQRRVCALHAARLGAGRRGLLRRLLAIQGSRAAREEEVPGVALAAVPAAPLRRCTRGQHEGIASC